MLGKNFASVIAAFAAAALLAGCSSSRYYKNDGPPSFFTGTSGASATPRVEAFSAAASRPYTVMGKRYTPATSDIPMRQTGIASWYGKQFHGNKTSIGEIYDMYLPTAAHTTMPLPSYARVTNLENGKSIIVRVNDRGPFLNDRIIDLSYAAAKTLGYVDKGTARVEVVRLTNAEIASGSWQNGGSASQPAAAQGIRQQSTSGWGIQVGSFSIESNALQFAAHAEAVLNSNGQNCSSRIVRDDGLYRVVISEGLSHDAAVESAKAIGALLGCSAFAIQK